MYHLIGLLLMISILVGNFLAEPNRKMNAVQLVITTLVVGILWPIALGWFMWDTLKKEGPEGP